MHLQSHAHADKTPALFGRSSASVAAVAAAQVSQVRVLRRMLAQISIPVLCYRRQFICMRAGVGAGVAVNVCSVWMYTRVQTPKIMVCSSGNTEY